MVKQCPYCKSRNIGKRSFNSNGAMSVRYLNYCMDCGEVEWWEMKDWNVNERLRK